MPAIIAKTLTEYLLLL